MKRRCTAFQIACHADPTLTRLHSSAVRRVSGTCGFSLLEMIVATAVFGLAVVGLLALVTGALANAARVREYDRAAMLARTRVNELLVQDPLPLATPLSGEFDSSSGWEARAQPFELPPVPSPGATMLVRISLKIWWRAEGRRKSIELEGYRRMRILPEHGIR